MSVRLHDRIAAATLAVVALAAGCSATDSERSSTSTSVAPAAATDPAPIADSLAVECTTDGGTTSSRVRAHRDGAHVSVRGASAQLLFDRSGPSHSESAYEVGLTHLADSAEGEQVVELAPGIRYDLRCRSGDPPQELSHPVGSFEVADPDHVWISTPTLSCPTFRPHLTDGNLSEFGPRSALLAQVKDDLMTYFGPDLTVEITGYPDGQRPPSLAAWLRGRAVATMSSLETREHTLEVEGLACAADAAPSSTD